MRYLRKLFDAALRLIFQARAWKYLDAVLVRLQVRRTATGEVTFPFVHRRRSRSVQILAYHRVNDDRDPFSPGIPTRLFAQEMEHLATYCYCCSLEEAVERLKLDDVPDNTVAVTFDDGYRDNYLHALPVFEKFSIPATIFLATDVIDSGKLLWHDQVIHALRSTPVLALAGFGDEKNYYPLQTLQEKLHAQSVVLNFLRSLNMEERRCWIDRLLEKLQVGPVAMESGLMLTWEEIRLARQHGVILGAHTATHPILSKVALDVARQEIFDSKRILETGLGEAVRSFAYPSGRREDFDATTKHLVREAGYTCAVSMMFGVNESRQDPFELRRIPVWDADVHTFAARLSYYRFCS